MATEISITTSNATFELLCNDDTGLVIVNKQTDTGIEDFGTFDSIEEAEDIIMATIEQPFHTLQ